MFIVLNGNGRCGEKEKWKIVGPARTRSRSRVKTNKKRKMNVTKKSGKKRRSKPLSTAALVINQQDIFHIHRLHFLSFSPSPYPFCFHLILSLPSRPEEHPYLCRETFHT